MPLERRSWPWKLGHLIPSTPEGSSSACWCVVEGPAKGFRWVELMTFCNKQVRMRLQMSGTASAFAYPPLVPEEVSGWLRTVTFMGDSDRLPADHRIVAWMELPLAADYRDPNPNPTYA